MNNSKGGPGYDCMPARREEEQEDVPKLKAGIDYLVSNP